MSDSAKEKFEKKIEKRFKTYCILDSMGVKVWYIEDDDRNKFQLIVINSKGEVQVIQKEESTP